MDIRRLSEVARRPRRVALGTFDGVHLGHRAVIAGSESVVTFDPHPTSVVAPGHTPKLLTDFDVKADLIASLGVAELLVVDFDEAFAQRSARDFIDEMLLGTLGVVEVSVGENFRFGHKAQGDAALLRSEDRFVTTVHPLLEVDGEVVSSSHIRGLVAAGDVERANRMLGAPFRLRGEVVHGDERGRELGFPTANLVPDERIVCPGHGVYAALADGRASAVSVGVRPTFETGRMELIEAYIMDFEGDLYGEILEIQFLARMRGERRFESAQALIEQIDRDVVQARQIARAHVC